MRTLKYIWRNVTRNKLRTSLTILSIGFSLALMTVLHGFMATQSVWGNESKKYNRIVALNVQGFSGRMPISYIEKVRGMEGIVDAVPYSWYGGLYKDEAQMSFAQFGTDAEHAFNVWPEFKIDPEQLKAWQSDNQGCVADKWLAEQQGWKIGDKIPLRSTFYTFPLDLKLVGIFEAPNNTGQIWFHWKYLDEGLRNLKAPGEGNAGMLYAKVKSSSLIPDLVKKIDAEFASSEFPVRTQTEAAFAQMFSDMMGNVQGFIQSIGIAVVFSLSLVAANAMAMSMRERTTEIAVLKAIGFPRGRVMRMILGESCLIALLGGILGVAIGCAFLELGHRANPQLFAFSVVSLAGAWMLALLAVAAGIGFVSGIVPSVRAAQLSVVDGLRRVV